VVEGAAVRHGRPGGPRSCLLWLPLQPAGPHPPEPAVLALPPARLRTGRALLCGDLTQPPLNIPLLLYIGPKTSRADLRCKGDHDCKDLPAAYGEGPTSRPNSRAWPASASGDVPGRGKARQSFEQALIRRCSPPFNKGNAPTLATPFTSDLG